MPAEDLVRQVGLAFELPRGGYLEERVAISGLDIGSVLAEAEVFGRHAEFGRTYLGLTGHLAALDDAMEDDDETTLQSVHERDAPPQLDDEGMAEFLDDLGLDSIPEIEELEQYEALDPSFETVRWWEYDAAFGQATSLAIDLKRCCATDPAFAGGAAFSALDAMLHQGSLYPATPVALPYLVDLIVDERIECRRVLASGLLQIVQATAEVPDRGRVVEMFERLGTGLLKLPPLGRSEFVGVLRRHVDAAREIREIWPRQAVRLGTVADDEGLGQSVRKSLAVLEP